MTDHRHTLASFLRTDSYRLDSALEGRAWSRPAQERFTDHLRYMAQLQAVYLERLAPRDPVLLRRLARLEATSVEEALRHLEEQTGTLIAAIQEAPDSLLDAHVLDPHERGLSVLGHLYDFCRANAMLVEWARGLPLENEQQAGTVSSLVGAGDAGAGQREGTVQPES